jgi:DNA-binding transcriptional ArsR family regulator
MAEKYINVNLDDPRSERIAEVLANKTCKKILGLLAEKEMNASEIAEKLGAPLNTVGYNLEKLVEAGLIEKARGFLWSVKGKKIDSYIISNKKIVIAPRKMIKGIIPAILISGLIALGIRFFMGAQKMQTASSKIAEKAGEAAAPMAGAPSRLAEYSADKAAAAAYHGYEALVGTGHSWLWFLLGAFVGLLVFLIWNWKKL